MAKKGEVSEKKNGYCWCGAKRWKLFDPCMLDAPFPDYLHGLARIRCWLWRLYYCIRYNVQDLRDGGQLMAKTENHIMGHKGCRGYFVYDKLWEELEHGEVPSSTCNACGLNGVYDYLDEDVVEDRRVSRGA